MTGKRANVSVEERIARYLDIPLSAVPTALTLLSAATAEERRGWVRKALAAERKLRAELQARGAA